MSKGFLSKYIVCVALCIIIAAVLLYKCLPDNTCSPYISTYHLSPFEVDHLPATAGNKLVQYGHALITNTADYLGPNGSVSAITNGMNCGNCHLEAGTRNNGNSYLNVAATYPKFRQRSGRIESIEYRVNDCLQRSLNGKPLDSSNYEMTAIVAYIKWLGKIGVSQKLKQESGTAKLMMLDRAASAVNGEAVYGSSCVSCHGADGKGVKKIAANGYVYPPLWGSESYNTSAGMYMLSKLAGFIKHNMPYEAKQGTPVLSDEQAWDVAAYIASQPRPHKRFNDWPKLASKPVDYPYGPYADSFTEQQHKYGPYKNMKAL